MRVPVAAPLLRWACARNNRSVDDYADRFPKLPAWLAGDAQPTLKQLEDFAHVTHTPIGYLFLAEPPVERLPLPDFRTLPSAVQARPSPDLLDTIYACQQRQDWYREFARTVGEAPRAFVGSVRLDDDVVRTAARIRDTLGFDLEARARASTWTEALRQLIEHADDAGILVMVTGVVLTNSHRHLDPEEFRGFAIADDYAPLVFINGADTKAAQMFTLAHELAHVWLGQSAVTDAQAGRPPEQRTEQWCNQVAAELLVPLEAIRREHQRSAPLRTELDHLARRYKVSTLVVLRRLHDTGALTRAELWDEHEKEQARLRAVPRKSGGDFYRTLPARVSKRFTRAIITSAWEGRSSFTEAFRLLGVKKMETFRSLSESLGMGY